MNKEGEYLYISKNKDIIFVFFGGMGSFNRSANINDTLPYEFHNFMNNNYSNTSRLFFVDYHQSWYNKGLFRLSTTFEYCCEFIQHIISNYKKVCFVGISSGGYAAILFGSELNVDNVLAFSPQTNLNLLVKNGIIGHHNVHVDDIYSKHMDLNHIINKTTQYIIYGNIECKDSYHHINQCLNISDNNNVLLKENPYLSNYKLMIKTKYLNNILDHLMS